VPIGSKFLQVAFADEVPVAHAILPQRVAYNLALGNSVAITNPNLEVFYIVHL
jgi:hypothetical protein